jgi:hypothetical protein
MPPTWIAEEAVVFVDPSGQRSNGRIAVGLPAQISDVEARCPIALDGLEHTGMGPISGSSTLQALLLAIRFLGMRLQDHLSRGYRVVHPEDESDVPLVAFFGRLLANPEPVTDGSDDDEDDP